MKIFLFTSRSVSRSDSVQQNISRNFEIEISNFIHAVHLNLFFDSFYFYFLIFEAKYRVFFRKFETWAAMR